MGFTPIRVLAIGLLLAAPAIAETRYETSEDYGHERRATGDYDDAGTFSMKPGLGFTASPTSFLLGIEGDYRIADPVSVGALGEFGIGDELTIVTPVLFARYWPNLGRMIDPDLSAIQPYAHVGVGFSYWDAN